MHLVDVGQFLSIEEAQVAASAMRASGIEVHLQNELHGTVSPFLRQALGGFRVWVAEQDVDAARALLSDAQSQPLEPIKSSLPARKFFGWLGLALFGG